MNKTLLIFRHEFVHTIKRVGFIIMTLIVPVLALLAIGIFHIVSGVIEPTVETVNIGYVDEAGVFTDYTVQGSIIFHRYDTTADATRALTNGEIPEYIVIPGNYLSTGAINRYTLEKQLETPPSTAAATKNFLTSNLLSGKVPEQTTIIIQSPLMITVTRLTETGAVATDQGGYANLLVPAIFALLLALSFTFSSAYLLQGLGEEKESRLIEVLLSSVSTRQLLVGKIMGLGAAGLIQVAVWLISLPLLLNLASTAFGGFFSNIQLPSSFVILGIVYFILGYLMFAVISAGIGAITPNAREGQQLATIFTLGAIAPLWFSSPLMFFPDSPIWIALSVFPLTAPVEVMLRVGVSGVPGWQLALSIAVLALTIAGLLWLAVKVLRTYLLMYGKRPALGEIFRNIRNA